MLPRRVVRSKMMRTFSTTSLGVMKSSLADSLMESTAADFASAAELPRAHQFVREALLSVRTQLPPTVEAVLDRIGAHAPAWKDSVPERVCLWQSIESDQMGQTPAGAATRAALFAFPSDIGTDHNAGDVISYFTMYYCRAQLPENSLVKAFHGYWPRMTPNTFERTRER